MIKKNILLVDIKTIVATDISIRGNLVDLKGRYTPYVKLSYFTQSDYFISEAFSFFYKKKTAPASIESGLQSLESKLCLLTTEALSKKLYFACYANKDGYINFLKISEDKKLIIAVIADSQDSSRVCNSVTSLVDSLFL